MVAFTLRQGDGDRLAGKNGMLTVCPFTEEIHQLIHSLKTCLPGTKCVASTMPSAGLQQGTESAPWGRAK